MEIEIKTKIIISENKVRIEMKEESELVHELRFKKRPRIDFINIVQNNTVTAFSECLEGILDDRGFEVMEGGG